MSTVAPPAQNTFKRDYLISLEQAAQKRWQEEKLFEAESPYAKGDEKVLSTDEKGQVEWIKDAERIRETKKKWFGTFPYAYQNGSLHLGHAFTISKIEFAAGFERMKGKTVLWPVGFHATGMPIKAASDKLIREMEMFGSDFSGYQPPSAIEDDSPSTAPAANGSADPSKAKKGKLAAKSTGLTYQFQIMESIGVKREDIKKFADTDYWLDYFPPITKADITSFGGRVDWRRSFITTPANAYYDAFVRWQMNKLYKLGYIKFGKRYTIFSPKDGQPCMDHDRASGEGVGPQEYTAIKMPVVEWGERAARVKELVGSRKVVFVAATLRPETMYGQTNCFVGPNVTYGLYPSSSTVGSTEEVYYLVTPRAARNMAFQSLLRVEEKVDGNLGEVKGSELIGTKLNAPNSVKQQVYVLPMDSVSATKGTAVVTCVPSDSPDDWITTVDLRKKAAYYGIDPAWVAAESDIIPVITTPTYGDLVAKTLCEQLKINSPKDVKLLAEAKETAYKEGFYNGTMVFGDYKGMKVEDAKPKVREDMIKNSDAFAYSEPENMVMSRSADECVVSLCDQWYLDYGQPGWLKKAELLLSRMNTYSDDTKHGFEKTLGWLRQWACARSYGLGSKLPWDPQFLVESLSDSTIYMAYYTISHLLHENSYFGTAVGPLGITPEQMTDEIWDYIYSNGAFPSPSPIPLEKVNKLKAEFSYFYPMDVRSSGKDLIPNHLSFCIYVHSALFAEEYWPLSMRANGHLMLNGEKMSKSTGNSLTLRDSLVKFGADATRITLADAGDSIEDANFEEATANAAILRLNTLLEWCKDEYVKNQANLRTGEYDLWDKIFLNELNQAIVKTEEAYAKTLYKEALKEGFYSVLAARDSYFSATDGTTKMHVDLVKLFIRTQALLITPIAPHIAEEMWSTFLGEKKSIQLALYPKPTADVDPIILAQAEYLRSTVKKIRDVELAFAKKKGKGKSVAFDPSKPKVVNVYVAQSFPEWQEQAIEVVKSAFDEKKETVDDAKVKAKITEMGLIKDKRYMPFIYEFKKRIATLGPKVAFQRTVLFNEKDLLTLAMPFIEKQLGFDKPKPGGRIDVIPAADAKEADQGYEARIVEAAEPGSPGIVFYNA